MKCWQRRCIRGYDVVCEKDMYAVERDGKKENSKRRNKQQKRRKKNTVHVHRNERPSIQAPDSSTHMQSHSHIRPAGSFIHEATHNNHAVIAHSHSLTHTYQPWLSVTVLLRFHSLFKDLKI